VPQRGASSADLFGADPSRRYTSPCEQFCQQPGADRALHLPLRLLGRSPAARTAASTGELHLYDSFAGLLPTADVDGDSYRAEELSTSVDVVWADFARYGLGRPAVHPGWFDETLPGDSRG
jgi:Macrocin-O-methyltransferase (TylF)